MVKCEECGNSKMIRVITDYTLSYEYKPEISTESMFHKVEDIPCPHCSEKK